MCRWQYNTLQCVAVCCGQYNTLQHTACVCCIVVDVFSCVVSSCCGVLSDDNTTHMSDDNTTHHKKSTCISLSLYSLFTYLLSLSLHLLSHCSVLQCVAVCCSVLQCVAVCCSVLMTIQHTTRNLERNEIITLSNVYIDRSCRER